MIQVRFRHFWVPFETGLNFQDKPGRWMVGPEDNEAQELWTFVRIDLEYERDRVAYCLEIVELFERGDVVQGYVEEGYAPPGLILDGNDGAAYFGNNHVLIASNYADDARVVMTSEQLKILLRHILTTMDHPNYRNPDVDADDPFEPVTVEIIAHGHEAEAEYYKRGGITPNIPEQYR